MRAIALLIVLTSTGCQLFATNQGTDCDEGFPAQRDPQTGLCGDFGDQFACSIEDAGRPDYGNCVGPCDSATESMCLDLQGCRAAYAGGSFLACWSTAPSGPIHDGVCAGLDAHECSRHDNCAAWYAKTGSGLMSFDHCADEVPAPS